MPPSQGSPPGANRVPGRRSVSNTPPQKADSGATQSGGTARGRGGQGPASRPGGLVGAIFTYAVRHRMRADNPVHGVMRFADGRRERRLSDDEYAAFGEGLRQAAAAGIWPPAIAAARF